MKSFDVVIIGAGLAGLQCAKNLARNEAKVLLVDRKTDLTKGVHTTRIFVRKTFEDFDFPPATLGKPISKVNLYSPKLRQLEMESEVPEFRVARMDVLYRSLLDECIDAGVDFINGARFISSEIAKHELENSGDLNFHIENILKTLGFHTRVNLEKNGKSIEFKTKVLIGADGARSRVAKDLGLDENKEWIVGYEEIYKGVPLEGEPVLHCFLDAKLSPGYLAWVTNDGEDSHIGVGGYPSRFNPREALKLFKKDVAEKIIDLGNAELVESRGGRIPVGGVLKNIANERGLLIGRRQPGAVSPLTAGGLDPCMRLSKLAAEVVLERLKTDDPKVLQKYSGEMFRAKFTTRLMMRTVLKRFSYQPLLELGFTFLKSKFGKKLAEKIFFRRASFPDVELKKKSAWVRGIYWLIDFRLKSYERLAFIAGKMPALQLRL